MVFLPEHTVEGALGFKAGLQPDIGDGAVGVEEQVHCIIQADFIEIAVEAAVKGPGKLPGQYIGTEIESLRHAGQGERLFEV